MDKELFVSTMAKIEELNQEQEMFNDVLRKLDPEFGGGYINSKAIDTLINLLKVLVNDEYDNIGYYIWELDFGKKYEDGMITSADGEILKMSNAGELFDFIQDNRTSE